MEDPRLAEYYAVPIGIRNIAKLSFQTEGAYNEIRKMGERKDERNNCHVCMYVRTYNTSTTSVPVHVCTLHTYIHIQLGDNCHLYQAARNCSRNFLWSNKAARVPDNERYVQPVWCRFPFTPLCCITVISTIMIPAS